MRSKYSLLCGGAFAVLFLSACNNSIIKDTARPSTWWGAENAVVTLASRPERRLTLVNVARYPKNKNEDKDGDENGDEISDRYGNFCSEPPADAAEAISSTFQAGLQGNAGNNQGGKAELASTLGTAIQALTQRSQGVILFRDASFRYCEAYLNGALDEAGYLTRLDTMYTAAHATIVAELTANKGKIGYGPFLPLTAPELRQVTSILSPAPQPDQEEDETPAGDGEAAPNDAE